MKKLFVLSLLFSVPIFCMNQQQRRLIGEQHRLQRDALCVQRSELRLKKLKMAMELAQVRIPDACPDCGRIGTMLNRAGTAYICSDAVCARAYTRGDYDTKNVEVAARAIAQNRSFLCEDDDSMMSRAGDTSGIAGAAAAALADDEIPIEDVD